MLKSEIRVDQIYFEGNGVDVGAGWNPLEDALSIDMAVRGEPFVPSADPSKAIWRADAADLPLKDGVCDYIFCSHFLEHVADRLPAILAEFARVLKAGGYLIANTPDLTTRLADGTIHGLAPETLPPLLNAAGFEVLQIDTVHDEFTMNNTYVHTFELVARKM